MLRGMAIECLFKGILAKEKILKINDGKLNIKQLFGGSGHNLLKIAGMLDKLTLNKNEKIVLNELTKYSEFGRLPVPITPKNEYLFWQIPECESIFDGIYKKIQKLIAN